MEPAIIAILERYIKVLKHRAKNIRKWSKEEGYHYYANTHEEIAKELSDIISGRKTIEQVEEEEHIREQDFHDHLRWAENGGPPPKE